MVGLFGANCDGVRNRGEHRFKASLLAWHECLYLSQAGRCLHVEDCVEDLTNLGLVDLLGRALGSRSGCLAYIRGWPVAVDEPPESSERRGAARIIWTTVITLRPPTSRPSGFYRLAGEIGDCFQSGLKDLLKIGR